MLRPLSETSSLPEITAMLAGWVAINRYNPGFLMRAELPSTNIRMLLSLVS